MPCRSAVATCERPKGGRFGAGTSLIWLHLELAPRHALMPDTETLPLAAVPPEGGSHVQGPGDPQFAATALVSKSDYERLYAESMAGPDAFWARIGQRMGWM